MPPIAAQPGGPAGARRGRDARAAQGPGRALPGRRRVHRGARARRWPAATSSAPPSSRTPSRRSRSDGPAQVAGRDRRADRARARRGVAVGAYLLLAPETKRRCPTSSASAPRPRRRSLQSEGFEVDVVPIQSDTVARGPRRRPGPGAGRPRPRRARRSRSPSPTGPARRPCRSSQGLPADEATDQLREAASSPSAATSSPTRSRTDRVIETSPPEGAVGAQGLDGHARRLARQGEGRRARRRRPARRTRPRRRCATPASRSASTEREDADAEPGTVLEQDPAAGTQVAKGATVDARRRQGARRGRRCPA